jgi:hypothetical protein
MGGPWPVREQVIISYRGASYEIGLGPGFYGIWTFGAPDMQPAEWWPQTPDGWVAAWARFVGIEAPGSIVPVEQRTAPVPSVAPTPAFVPTTPVTSATPVTPATAFAPTAVAAPTAVTGSDITFVDTAVDSAARTSAGGRTKVALALLGLGLVLGGIGLFPNYLTGASLASQSYQLVPHLVYLVTWGLSAALIVSGGSRRRLGAFVGLGASIITFGLFFTDAGTPITYGSHVMGAGLVLSLAGWLACTVGCVAACRTRTPGGLRKPRRHEVAALLTLGIPALGAAIAFAPSWDHFALHTAAGQSDSLSAGNAFSNPAALIAGSVAVMVALVLVALLAALWRPVRLGGALLAGAIVPLAAQVVSALIQLSQTTPEQFGISAANASRAGLTIDSGVTLAFWIYCAFIVALIALCAQMFIGDRSPQMNDNTAVEHAFG